MKGQKPERGRSQGRGVRHERSAATRASILGGSPSGGYRRQNRLHRGAPLYCVIDGRSIVQAYTKRRSPPELSNSPPTAQRTLRFDCSPISNTCTDGKASAFRLRRDERVGVRNRWFLSDPRFISSTSSNPTITASFCQTTII